MAPSTPKNPRLQAALELAEAGYKIFPVPPGSKKSHVAKGMRFGSGEAWGMTDNRDLIEKYWRRWPKANIGLPTGAVNGFVVIETDSPKGHAKLKVDGETSLKTVEDRLGPLPTTRVAESPSGSRHRLYGHPGGRVKNSASELGPGIDVRGDGGMVVAPPSERKDGAYRWVNDLPIADLPQAWIEALTEEREEWEPQPKLREDANWAEIYGAEDDEKPALEEVKAALDCVLNDDLGWEQWNDVGMRLYAWSSGDEGLQLFDEWSQQSSKYDRAATKEKWRRFHGTPPTRYGARSIINLAYYGSGEDGGAEEGGGDSDSELENLVDQEMAKPPPLRGGETREHVKKRLAAEINGKHAAATDNLPKQGRILIPYNFWDEYETPDMIEGIFPKVIERLATVMSEVRGSDPAGLAMGGLLGCGAAIPDCYKIQPKPHSDPSWTEDGRIWVAMVGGVASIKTSTVKSIRKPFYDINDEMLATYGRLMAEYNSKSAEEKKEEEEPYCQRIVISDSTSQGCQDIMRYNEDGLLNVQDELGHFYGALDQFSHAGNAGAERYFWTQTYDGGRYFVDRVNKQRKFVIQNCGMSLFGGIQPDVIRKYGDNSANDGLLQRSLFVMLKKAEADKDIPSPPVQDEYNELIFRLHRLQRGNIPPLNFTPEASRVRERFVQETLKLSDMYAGWNGKLGEHISKWRGMFCRICLIIHFPKPNPQD